MKIALIEIEPIVKYPPAMSVLKTLVDSNHTLSFYSTKVTDELREYCKVSDVNLIELGEEYNYNDSPLKKMNRMFKLRREIWKQIEKKGDSNSLLWVFSTITLKHLGKKLLDYQYVLHLFELVEELTYFKGRGKINLKEYLDHAKKVVVCEENRAHITKTWFRLNELPTILPNKPYQENFKKNNIITSSEINKSLIDSLIEKKIILYQGILDDERPLEEFIYAVDELGDEYAFVIMSGSKNKYKYIKSKNFYFINYVPAPYHLEITSHAYIGVLSYVPNYDGYSSPLNSIYCAPNKTFEYACFSIPMIGNDIPGLKNCLETNFMGKCVKNLQRDEIKKAIKYINENYEKMSSNSKNYYDSVNINQIIENILASS